MKASSKGATTKNEKILLGILGIAAILTLCYIIIIAPSAKKNKSVKNEIVDVENQLKEVQLIDYEIKNKREQLEELQKEYDVATAGLPKTDRYPQIAKDVEQMAIDCGLVSVKGIFRDPSLVKSVDKNGTDVTNDANNEFQGMKYLQVDYSFGTDFEKTLEFIDKLENDERIADIAEVSQGGKETTVSVFFYCSGGNEKEEYDFN